MTWTFPTRALTPEAGNAHVQTCSVFSHTFLIHFFIWRFSSHLYFRKSTCLLALYKPTGIMAFRPQTTCSNSSVYSEHVTRSCPKADMLWSAKSPCCFLPDRELFSIFMILGTLEKCWSFSFSFFFKYKSQTQKYCPAER